ncbi:patched domain-containing protein 3-like [Actinia tenebrosa]|uniref:Patched domain-containing protein 3-like n=1 Tax=Actinia tenebrosa TaxID=6105 RepID=A0A6P8IKG6_ACTTE|nr:patched domain-containing protein 3-like [Actinia tenebrosa]
METESTNTGESTKPSTCRGCCHKYNAFPAIVHHLFEKAFGWLGKTVAKHPWPTILICLVVVGVCSVGFMYLQSENRVEKLYVPPGSTSVKDLVKASQFFKQMNARTETVIFVPRSAAKNIISRDCLLEILNLHNAVISLKSFEKFCIKNTITEGQAKCVYINPLEIFNFEENSLYNVSSKIGAAYYSRGQLMANGRPVYMNFGLMFANPVLKNQTLQSADAVQVQYYISDEEEDYEAIVEWEETFIKKVMELKTGLTYTEMYYSAERSLSDATSESTGSDITLISITFTLMITFACTILLKFRNPLTGHALLGNLGILAVGLGILAGLGLAMFVQTPFISIVGVLPFLILGIGIDDVFIIIDELDRLDYTNLNVLTTVKVVMSHSGATITMTTLTDLVAFAVSTSTQFPSIRYFCTYAALTITFSYLMIITFFVAFLSFDVRRIKAGRRDFLPICRAPPVKEGSPAWTRPSQVISSKIMKKWAEILMLPAVRAVVVVLSLGLLGVSVYYGLKISENFDRRLLAKKGAQIIDFLDTQDRYFEGAIPVSLVISTRINYEDSDVQSGILKLSKIATENTYYMNRTLSWMESLRSFAKSSGFNVTGSSFLPTLKVFLGVPAYAHFRQDVIFSDDNTTILASRVLCYMKPSTSSIVQKDAMLTIRGDLTADSDLPVYPIAKVYIYLEQYAITKSETTRNIAVAGVTVFVITLPFLLSLTASLIIFFGFGALIFELFALMYLWDVSLNMISTINLVMAIGFSVDYSAHIAHAYVLSSERRPEDRAIQALSTMGASVLMGGTSTFIGMIVTAFASSQIFIIFFKMFFGIVVLGLLHGLCFLPVYLSLLCRWAPIKNKKNNNNGSFKNGAVGTDGQTYDPSTKLKVFTPEKPVHGRIEPIFLSSKSQASWDHESSNINAELDHR